MQDRRLIVGVARLSLGISFVGVGALGIARGLAPAPRSVRPSTARTPGDGMVPYASRRVEFLSGRLERAPDDPDLNLKLARCYNTRATVMAHQEYSESFPDAFQYGKYPPGHYDTWRRGWFRRDRVGDLRRALDHASRASKPDAPQDVRLTALHLTVHVLRLRGEGRRAMALLEQIVHLAPRDDMAWLQLSESYRVYGDIDRYRAARRRLDAIWSRQSARDVRMRKVVAYNLIDAQRQAAPLASQRPRPRPVARV